MVFKELFSKLFSKLFGGSGNAADKEKLRLENIARKKNEASRDREKLIREMKEIELKEKQLESELEEIVDDYEGMHIASTIRELRDKRKNLQQRYHQVEINVNALHKQYMTLDDRRFYEERKVSNLVGSDDTESIVADIDQIPDEFEKELEIKENWNDALDESRERMADLTSGSTKEDDEAFKILANAKKRKLNRQKKLDAEAADSGDKEEKADEALGQAGQDQKDEAAGRSEAETERAGGDNKTSEQG